MRDARNYRIITILQNRKIYYLLDEDLDPI